MFIFGEVLFILPHFVSILTISLPITVKIRKYPKCTSVGKWMEMTWCVCVCMQCTHTHTHTHTGLAEVMPAGAWLVG